MRVPLLRRSDQPAPESEQEPDQKPEQKPAEPTDDRNDTTTVRRRSRVRDRRSRPASEFSAKVEEAAERAAAATRTAAAAAAADRAHARARTSVVASLSLVLAVAAALAVATGELAGLGVVVGGLALLFALAGLSVTGRHYRYLGGRGEATVALLLSLAAIVVGTLALADALSWLDTGTDQVARLRDALPTWLT